MRKVRAIKVARFYLAKFQEWKVEKEKFGNFWKMF